MSPKSVRTPGSCFLGIRNCNRCRRSYAACSNHRSSDFRASTPLVIFGISNMPSRMTGRRAVELRTRKIGWAPVNPEGVNMRIISAIAGTGPALVAVLTIAPPLATTSTAYAAQAPDPAPYVAKARAAAKALATALKARLEQAISEGGAENAIRICNIEAPEIADAISADTGLSVGRTALKWRNPANRPNDWERAVLKRFEREKAAGADLKKLEHFAFLTEDGKPVFRYMKAIPTAEVCLACHGSDLAPELVEKLDKLYPQDRARGFKVGDLRGAFTITAPVPATP
ncbi:MAG: DUF3365 domain-containing protein [Alphaproteobacteria bacterium]|nr:MAG: DUF3365 domain-containing protein [Alphaproteobacteria bacterium]